MKKSKAFTLAEVLITLVIIGVIAAMTIPTLMGNTNNQELKTKKQKAISAVNQAIKLDEVLYGNNPTDFGESKVGQDPSALRRFKQTLMNHMSVIDEDHNWAFDTNSCFKTADGIIYVVGYGDPTPGVVAILKPTAAQHEGKGFSMIYDVWGGSKAFVDECTLWCSQFGMCPGEEEDCIGNWWL